MNKHLTATALACAAGWGVSAATAQITLEKVIANGDLVPGFSALAWRTQTAPFCFAAGATIDQNGNVAFRGILAVDGVVVTSANNNLALYGAPGNLQYLARTGDQAPGQTAGTNLTGFQVNPIPLSTNGTLWVGGTCTPGPSGFISTGPFGSLAKVVRNGDTMPGGDVLSANPASTGSSSANVNSAGQIAFLGQIPAGPIASFAAYVGGPGTLQLACKEGVPYASLPSFSGFTTNGLGFVFLNGHGNLSCGGMTSTGNEVVFTRAFGAADGDFTVIAVMGDAAPDCGGATYSGSAPNFQQFRGNYNNEGHLLFGSGLQGAGTSALNNFAVWYYDGAGAHLFRRMGDPTTSVPGATLAFSQTNAESARMRLNNSDTVVWNPMLAQGVGGVTSANDATIIRTALGSSTDQLIAREGSQVRDPVTNAIVIPGAIYGSPPSFPTPFGGLQQNNGGQFLFITNLADDPSDPGHVFTSNNQALMAWDPVQGLMLVYRKGDDISSIVGFVPDSISLGAPISGNAEGGSSVLADNGWFTFTVSSSIVSPAGNSAILRARIPTPCYANCDGSTTPPVLNVGDFTCFLQKYAAADPYANCDQSTTPPVLNVDDFTCFLQKYAAGCA
jgi:hypothetical protein